MAEQTRVWRICPTLHTIVEYLLGTTSAEPQQLSRASLETQSDASTSAELQQLSSALLETQQIQKVSDSIYRVYPQISNADEVVVPDVEIAFLHGVTRPEQKEAYIETWKTPDGSVLWPQAWLPRVFSRAFIYLVSYDSSAWTDPTHGRLDLFLAGEVVFRNFLVAKIGQTSRCPLILVGHGIGGLVIEQICVQANKEMGRSADRKHCQGKLFLEQLKGIFCLATPYGGLPLMPKSASKHMSEIYARREVFNEETCRLIHHFQMLKRNYSWKTFNVQPTHGPEDDQLNYCPEASGRAGGDPFVVIDTDSDHITKPKDEESGSFPFLRDFIEGVLSDFTVDRKRPLPFRSDSSYVPIVETVEKVQKLLQEKKIVVLCGEPGIGKSSLVKHMALQYQEQKLHDSVFRHGCYFVECVRTDTFQTVQQKLLIELLGVDEALKYKPAIFLQKLRECLQHLDVLIIMDNVWKYELLGDLKVVGKNIKYLLTAQESDPWIGGYITGMEICKMNKIDFKYGKRILVEKFGFPNGIIPVDVKMTVTQILEITRCNPVVLETLSMEVRENRPTSTDEWVRIMQKLHCLLESYKGAAMNEFNRKYRGGLYASERMMYAVKFLEPKYLKLLSLLSLYRGSFIDIEEIRNWARCIRPGWETKVDDDLQALGARTLIEIRKPRDGSRVLSVSIDGLRPFLSSTSDEPLRSIREEIINCLEKLNPCGWHRHRQIPDTRLRDAFYSKVVGVSSSSVRHFVRKIKSGF